MDGNDLSSSAGGKMMGEFKSVIKDAEDLLKNTEQQTGEGFKVARAKFESTLKTAKSELLRLEQTVVEKTKDAARTTDEYVKDHPWKSVGLGACVGLIVGLLIGRK
jgi:ElaB/YqjD/DUF883 family membrane-anchored ribosome-binding protein